MRRNEHETVEVGTYPLPQVVQSGDLRDWLKKDLKRELGEEPAHWEVNERESTLTNMGLTVAIDVVRR